MSREQLPPPTAPHEVAGIIADEYRLNGCHTLRRWRGMWMRWESSHWAELEDADVRASTYKRLAGTVYPNKDGELIPWNPTKSKVTDVLDALKACIHLESATESPTWLNAATIDPAEVVACTNGLLHVTTRTVGALTPYFFNRVSVPFDYNPDAPRPQRWLRFLDQLWPDDPDSIAALQEWFGYVLSGRTDMQKILFVQGPKRSGKGTIARILRELVGRGNAAAPTADSLGANFGLMPLVGKPLAIIPDARIGGPNVRVIVERLLSISGEDSLTIDRKYREPWTGKLPTRMVMMSNDLPTLSDASSAIIDRFVVLTLRRSFLGREDTHLTDDLLTELPGILLWALDGLDRIAGRANFTAPDSSTDSIAYLHASASPISAFVSECCVVGAGHEVPKDDLFKAWREWCSDTGHHPGAKPTFAKNLHSAVPSVRASRPHSLDGWPTPSNGERIQCHAGIGLLSRSGHGQGSQGENPNTHTHAREEPDTPLQQTMRLDPDHPDRPDCPHGMPGGAEPDYDLLAGKTRCPRCRAEENR